MAEEEQVGVVAKYFAKPCVAAVKVTGGNIKKGDVLRFSGHHRILRRSHQHGSE